jgi:hypothetical protein
LYLVRLAFVALKSLFGQTAAWCSSAMQEIVFIGAGMDDAAIAEQLDGALLTDGELQRYDQKWGLVSAPSVA